MRLESTQSWVRPQLLRTLRSPAEQGAWRQVSQKHWAASRTTSRCELELIDIDDYVSIEFIGGHIAEEEQAVLGLARLGDIRRAQMTDEDLLNSLDTARSRPPCLKLSGCSTARDTMRQKGVLVVDSRSSEMEDDGAGRSLRPRVDVFPAFDIRKTARRWSSRNRISNFRVSHIRKGWTLALSGLLLPKRTILPRG